MISFLQVIAAKRGDFLRWVCARGVAPGLMLVAPSGRGRDWQVG